MTDEMTSLPKLSNTKTFQMGSPLAPRTGAVEGIRPFEVSACCSVLSGFGWSTLRLRIFPMDSVEVLLVIADW